MNIIDPTSTPCIPDLRQLTVRPFEQLASCGGIISVPSSKGRHALIQRLDNLTVHICCSARKCAGINTNPQCENLDLEDCFRICIALLICSNIIS